MESQPQNPEFRSNPENFHPLTCDAPTCLLIKVTILQTRNEVTQPVDVVLVQS